MTSLCFQLHFCVNWRPKKADIFFLIATALAVALGYYLWVKSPNPNPESARYLLSTIPQVTGTTFVILIAVMQMLGKLSLKEFIKRPEFIITGFACLGGIIVSMLTLYLDGFCKCTSICLSIGVWNLMLIAWFIIRIVPAQDIAKEKAIGGLESESTLELKKKALEALSQNVPSFAIKVIEEFSQRAIEELNQNNDLQVAKDCCTAIRDIGQHKPARFQEVWKAAAELLIDIDKLAHSKGKVQFSHTVTLPFLKQLSMSHYAGRYIPSPSLPQLKEYFWEVFKDELQNKQIDIQRKKNPNIYEIDGLDVELDFLFEMISDQKHYNELQDKVLEVLKDVSGDSSLRSHYGTKTLFALVLRLLLERTIYATSEEENSLSIAQDFATTLSVTNPTQLLEDSRDQISSLERQFHVPNSGRISEFLEKLKKRLSQPK